MMDVLSIVTYLHVVNLKSRAFAQNNIGSHDKKHAGNTNSS